MGNCDGPLDVGIVLRSMPSLRELRIYAREVMVSDQALQELGAGTLGRHLFLMTILEDAELSARLEQAVALRKIATENDVELPHLAVHVSAYYDHGR